MRRLSARVILISVGSFAGCSGWDLSPFFFTAPSDFGIRRSFLKE
jgi:hypothetical protein